MYKGRELLVEVDTGSGFATLGKLQSKTLSYSCEAVEVTDVDSDDWRTLDGQGFGTRNFSFSGSGVLHNSEVTVEFMQDATLSRTLINMRVTLGTGRSYQGLFKVTSFDISGGHNSAVSYGLAAESAGNINIIGGLLFCPVPTTCTPSAPWVASTGVLSQTANDVMWDGARFIVVGDGGLVWSSSDGASLTQEHSFGGSPAPNLTSIDYGNSIYVASVLGDGLGKIYTGPDLATWTSKTISGANWAQNDSRVGVRKARYFPGIGFVAVGAVWDVTLTERYPAIAFSSDGDVWTTVYTRIVSGGAGGIFDLTWDGTTITVVGGIRDPGEGNDTFRLHSTDGQNWTFQMLSPAVPTFNELRSIDFNCQTGVYVIGSQFGSLYRTTDFTSFTDFFISGSGDHDLLYYSDTYGRWVVGDNRGILRWSLDDGLTFTTSYDVGNVSMTFKGMADDHGVLGDRRYFAVGDDQTASTNFAFYSKCL